ITVTDVDSASLAGATVSITNFQAEDILNFTAQNGITGTYDPATGTLTLTGNATVAQYQTALQSITYQNNSENPNTTARTLNFTVNDGTSNSVAATRTINITAVNDTPALTATATALTYTENSAAIAIDSGITITDVDSANLSSATVSITGFQPEDVLNFTAQNGITGTYNSATGTLALSGNATVAQYQTALRSITYQNTSENPNTTLRTLNFSVNDGTSNSNNVIRTLQNTAVNDAPALDLNGVATAGINFGPVPFTAGGAAVAIVDTANLSVSDIDNANLAGATVTITNVLDGANELLAATTTGTNITANYLNGTLTLSGNDTLANYQQVLRSVTYRNTAASPNTTARTINFAVNDAGVVNNLSPTATSTVNITSNTVDLQLTQAVSNPAPTVGSNLTFTVSLTNAGTGPATGITVTDKLPIFGQTVTATASTGTYTNGLWTIPSLAAGASATLTFSGTVSVYGTISNFAQVTAQGQTDVDSTPNNFIATEDDQSYIKADVALPTSLPLSVVAGGTGGFALNGNPGGSGFSVSAAGDVNGDGLDDVIIGAPNSAAGGPTAGNAGRAYVVFGKIDNTAITLSSLGTGGFQIVGFNGGAGGGTTFAGWSVSAAGDINNDGFDDLIVGAPDADPNGVINSGSGFVVYGKTTTTAVNLSNLTAAATTEGFAVNGAVASAAGVAGDRTGNSVSNAGDVNGDGIDDVIVGAWRSTVGGNNQSGRAFIVYGKASNTNVNSSNLGTVGNTEGFAVTGIGAGNFAGVSVSNAGDVNGDGYDDVIVGTRVVAGAAAVGGQSYVVFGGPNINGVFALNTIGTGGANPSGFVIGGISPNPFPGGAPTLALQAFSGVSAAGDVNGDGFDDLVTGVYPANGNAGAAYVVFGKNNTNAVNMNTLGTNGFVINGIAANDQAGISVSNAGDVNGDGLDDLIVGARNANTTTGAAYLVYGKTGTDAVNLNALTASQGFAIPGTTAADQAGRSVSGAGDVNGDGYDDLLIGAYGANTNAGLSYVLFGGNFTNSVANSGGTNAELFTGTAAVDRLFGAQDNDTLIGGGGADVLNGGAGNDVISIADNTFGRISGGSGTDTLRLDGINQALNLTTIANNKITGIEYINLNGNGNSLSFNRLDVLDLSDTTNRLIIDGIAGNSVTSAGQGWTPAGTVIIGANSYNAYNNTAGGELLISAGITTTIS
ncbi:hypothetical protein NG798_18890, partial [Ancylothrix sp. C2]|uniref:beta strand repeat-containing protein n=1 Tax=Ancylothrix sp. D3o TaxID=2953691 RepID=UPI0021BAE19D|nr:hypothetical protein [Ancylothrix sp. D3o]